MAQSAMAAGLLFLVFKLINFGGCLSAEISNASVALDLRRSTVMMSSTIPTFDSGAGLVDGQLNGPGVCSITQSSYSDNGWHWILIDLGQLVDDISAIRIGTRTDRPAYSVMASNMELLGSIFLPYRPKLMEGINSDRRYNLNWSFFRTLGNTGSIREGTPSVLLFMPRGFTARWIALRRKQRINFCEVQILVNNYDSKCYDSTKKMFDKSQILGRHSTFNVNKCRQFCSKRTECRGLSVDDTGCRLYKSTVNSEPQITKSGRIFLEENTCHQGEIAGLEKITDRFWRIQKQANSILVKSVQFEGNILCREQPCAKIAILIEDDNRNFEFCNDIDTSIVSVLDLVTFVCAKPIKGSFVKLYIDKRAANSPELSIFVGHVRFYEVKTTTLSTISVTSPTSTIETSTRIITEPTSSSTSVRTPTTTMSTTSYPETTPRAITTASTTTSTSTTTTTTTTTTTPTTTTPTTTTPTTTTPTTTTPTTTTPTTTTPTTTTPTTTPTTSSTTVTTVTSPPATAPTRISSTTKLPLAVTSASIKDSSYLSTSVTRKFMDGKDNSAQVTSTTTADGLTYKFTKFSNNDKNIENSSGNETFEVDSSNSTRGTRAVGDLEAVANDDNGMLWIFITIGVVVVGVILLVVVLTVLVGICSKKQSKYNVDGMLVERPAKVYEVVYKDQEKTQAAVEVTYV